MAKNPRQEAKILAAKAKTADNWKTRANEAEGRLADMARRAKELRLRLNEEVIVSEQSIAAEIQETEKLRIKLNKVQAQFARHRVQTQRLVEDLTDENADLLEEARKQKRLRRYVTAVIAVVAVVHSLDFILGM